MFIYGMKMTSVSIQKAAGLQLRSVLRKMTDNRFMGVFSGFAITALIQSSSATTVMTVSFVNAGLLTLIESAGIMLGANIGTTVTAWFVSIFGFKFVLLQYAIPLFVIGGPMALSNRRNISYWGEFLIGVSILFLGLSFLQSSVPSINESNALFEFLQSFTEYGIFSRLFFVLAGAVITLVVQSSSASIAITLTMCYQGWIPFEIAACLILGENIGTTATAEIAALVTNTEAKRSARVHTFFNLIGVCWMVLLLPFILSMMSQTIQWLFDVTDPYTSTKDIPVFLAAFHTLFNTLNVLFLVGFIPLLIKLSRWSVRSKNQEQTELNKLKYISNASITPALVIEALHKEIIRFAEIVTRLNGYLDNGINSTDLKKRRMLLLRIQKYERIADNIQKEIHMYSHNLMQNDLSVKMSMDIYKYLRISSELLKISVLYSQTSEILQKKMESNIFFLPEHRNGINTVLKHYTKAFKSINSQLRDKQIVDTQTNDLDKHLQDITSHLRQDVLNLLKEDSSHFPSTLVFDTVFNKLEKIGDHLGEISKVIVP